MYGLVQSPPDSRDWNYAAVSAPLTTIPTQFKWPDTPLRDQGQHGSCVGFGSANMKDVQEMNDSKAQASPLYVWRRAKLIDGLPAGKEGTTIKAALTVLKDEGVCPEQEYPYSLVDTDTPPPISPNTEKGKISGYARCYTPADIKQALIKDGPVLIGIGVSQKFRDLGVGIHHVTTLFGEPTVGGHCMAITGYDDLRQSGGKTGFFRVKNSWADWGDGGYFWMAYDCMTERSDIGFGNFIEAWSTVDVKTGAPSGTRIVLRIGDRAATINNARVMLDAPPLIFEDRTLVPLRFVAENLGCKVDWDGLARTVTITR